MKLLTLLDEMEQLIAEGKSAPLTSGARVILEKSRMLDILEEIRFNLPDVIRQAEQVVHQRSRILSDADAEAEAVLAAARTDAERLVDEHDITTQAYAQAEEMLQNAQSNAREVRAGALAYADDIMADLEAVLAERLDQTRADRMQLQGDDFNPAAEQ